MAAVPAAWGLAKEVPLRATTARSFVLDSDTVVDYQYKRRAECMVNLPMLLPGATKSILLP